MNEWHHFDAINEAPIFLDEELFLCPETGGRTETMVNSQTDETYRGWQLYAVAGMSHTVTSRELVRQVPFRTGSSADSIFRSAAPNTPNCYSNVLDALTNDRYTDIMDNKKGLVI